MRVQIYDWLVGDGKSYIDTEIITPLERFYLNTKIRIIVNRGGLLFSNRIGSATYPCIQIIKRNDLSQLFCDYTDTRTILDYKEGDVFEIVHEMGLANTQGNSLRFFQNADAGLGNTISSDAVGDFELKSLDSDFHIHLYPCKLLSPYGTHPAGECCMIDVLSNTLYFNQGSGAFSVEGEAGEVIDTTPAYNNIISNESKVAVRLREWIKSTQGASPINVDFPLSQNPINARLLIDVEAGEKGNNGRHFLALTDDENIVTYVYSYWHTSERSSLAIWHPNGLYQTNFLTDNGVKNIKIYDDKVVTDIGSHIIKSKRLSRLLQLHYTCKEAVIGEVWQEGVFHLHPCELALPFENHPIGTACMIDLNSGDLYFNQGSGSFSCEGAFLGYWQDKPMTDHYCDVEGTLHRSVQIFADNGERLRLIWEKNLPFTTHRWLKGDVGTKINIAEYKTISAKVRLFQNSGSTLAGFGGNSLWSASHDNHSLAIQNGSGISWFDYNKCTAIIFPTTEYSIDYDAKLIVCNGFYLTIPINNRPIDLQVVDGLRAITIDGHTFTPAILDRPTLPTEDNNGIARKQGEAVFVDEERYKQGLPWVFGNVASSGSFSVSDE